MLLHFHITLFIRSQTYILFFAGADLALLSLSDHNIITFGTFGLWGALLGKDNKITICPKDFAKTDIGKEVHKAKRPDWIFL